MTVGDENAQLNPDEGDATTVSDTFPANPLTESVLTIVEFEKPTGKFTKTGLTVTTKSWTWNDTIVEWASVALVAVTVTV